MKKMVSLALAATLALSSSIVSYAEGVDSDLMKTELSIVKNRLNIPKELSEFNYNVSSQFNHDVYDFSWTTESGADEWKSLNCSIFKTVITYYSVYDRSVYSGEKKLAGLSASQLYSRAERALKQLNPTVYSSILIDKDSLDISLTDDTARFSIVRTKNGIPVNSDRGYIIIDKNSGTLLDFSINWHPSASFKSADGILTESGAQEKYADMIALKPYYEIVYNYETERYDTRIVYTQTDYGEINAYTGNKNDFVADGYYMNGGFAEDTVEGSTGDKGNSGSDVEFTEKEQAEIDKVLPYASEEGIRKIIDDSEYLSLDNDMNMSFSRLSRVDFAGEVLYTYRVSFTDADITEDEYYYNNSKDLSISVNAETGELLYYSYWDSTDKEKSSYDMEKAAELSADVLAEFAPTHVKDYTSYSEVENSYENYLNKTVYMGSSHMYNRVVNGIEVMGDSINMDFDSDMKLKYYYINYRNADFVSPDKMMTEQQIVDKFFETNDLELNYLAKLVKNFTRTVLVYSCDSNIYVDAFTGESIYPEDNSENDLSGISSAEIKSMAQILSDHGIMLSDNAFSENDAVIAQDFTRLLGEICGRNSIAPITEMWDIISAAQNTSASSSSNDMEITSAGGTITRGEAMKAYVIARFGDEVAALKGIYKSPFSDVSDTDPDVGFYAIAYADGAVNTAALNASEAYTYGDMITLAYNFLK